jgi:hypothetical protein
MNIKIKQFFNQFHWYKLIAYKFQKISVLKNPKAEANRAYYTVFKKNIDWDNPRDLVEKINWLQLHTDTSLWTKYADKYLVRDYVKECGYEDNLPDLYGKWENVDNIDFSVLPDEFVLKSNNGCGTVLIVKDKKNIKLNNVKKKLKRWLNLPYGYRAAQLHYLKIEPCIIAEELLVNNEEDILISSNSIIDYKIYCINGEPEAIWVAYDRTHDGVYHTMYDINWIKHPELLVSTNYYSYHEREIPKPKCLDDMLEMCRKLSRPFKQVRVDLYVIKNKPIFGEMTFATGIGFFTEEFYNYLGSKIDLSEFYNQRS